MSTIEDVFEGEWKSPEEYLIKCPYCGDHKTHNHCYVNVVKGMFICHHCGESGIVERLLMDHGDGEKVEREPGMVEKARYEEVDIESFKKVTGVVSTMDRMALTYLKGRGFTKEEIEKYDVRFSGFGRYFGRVIFPIVEHGENVSFISRSYMKTVYPKYLFPHHGETKLTTNECMWGWDSITEEHMRVVLVEGIIDAINVNRFVDHHALALHSKQMGEAQLLKLLRLSRDTHFIVMMDGDAHKDGLKIAKKLKQYGRNVEMSLLAKDEDPGSLDGFRFGTAILERTFPVDVNLAMRVYLGG